MSKSVFVSHAVKDRALVKEIVDLIEEGIGVPENEIFCSSLQGYGIPAGKNFVTYIKEQLLDPKVVILVLTPAYFESKFCVSELGAAWIKSHEIFPILVPPLEYGDIKDVLLGTQVVKVDDDIGYNRLREVLMAELEFTAKSQTKWDTKRRAFLTAIKPILAKVPGFSMVPAADLEAKAKLLEEAQAELDEYETTVRSLEQRLAKTAALKDQTEVADLAKEYEEDDVVEHFNVLTNEIAEFRSILRGKEVLKFALSRHYGKPYKIDWFQNRETFEEAARLGFIDADDDAVWDQRNMKALRRKLKELATFLRKNGEELEAHQDGDAPTDPDNQDFWEYHYGI